MKFFIVVCVIVIIGIFSLWFFQRKLIYFPSAEVPSMTEYGANDMTEIQLQTSDGLSIYGWFKKPTTKKVTIIYFHGNAGHIGNRMPFARQLINQGYGIFMLSYRGYGGNAGRPTESGLYSDALAAIKFLKSQGQCIVVMGESLGTGVASKIAVDNKVLALILQSPLTSMVDVARYHFPYIFIEPTDKYNTLSRIKTIELPLLVIHGKKDKVVPFEMGYRIFQEHSGHDKQFLAFNDKNHHNLWSTDFLQGILQFSDKINHKVTSSNTECVE